MKSDDTSSGASTESPISLEVLGKLVYHRRTGRLMHEAVSYADALKWVTDLYPWLRMKLFILIDSDRKQWTIKDLSAYVESSDHMIRRDLARLSKAGSITERSAMWEQGKPKQYTVMVAEVAAAVEAVPSPPPYKLWDDPRTYATEAGAEVWAKWKAQYGEDPEKWPAIGGKAAESQGESHG